MTDRCDPMRILAKRSHESWVVIETVWLLQASKVKGLKSGELKAGVWPRGATDSRLNEPVSSSRGWVILSVTRMGTLTNELLWHLLAQKMSYECFSSVPRAGAQA